MHHPYACKVLLVQYHFIVTVPLEIALEGTSSQSPGLSVPYFYTTCQSHPAVLDLDTQLATDVPSSC